MKEFVKRKYDKRSSKETDRRDSKKSNRRSFNRRDSSESFGGFKRRGTRAERMPHKVVCDSCGKECEVPFKPTAGKPVYCDDCFKTKGKSRSNKRDNCNYEDELKKVNQKLDIILEIVKGLKTIKDSAKAEEKTVTVKSKAKKATKKKL